MSVITTWPSIGLIFFLGIMIGWFAKDFQQFSREYKKENNGDS